MIGLNPWKLSRDKFCLVWLDSDSCSCRDSLEGRSFIKGSKIDSIHVIKVSAKNGSVPEIVGQWTGRFREDYEPIAGLVSFIGDSYLVSLYGNRYVFPMIDECLGRNKLPSLNREYTMDIGEVFGWVEDKEWVEERMDVLEKIYWSDVDADEKLSEIIKWLGENMLPLLRNGFR